MQTVRVPASDTAGKKCSRGSAASWAARSSAVKHCHRMSLFMRKLVSADFNDSFHRSKLKTQVVPSAVPGISQTCFDGEVRAQVGGFVF